MKPAIEVHSLTEKPDTCFQHEHQKNTFETLKTLPCDSQKKPDNCIRFVCISDTHNKTDITALLATVPDDCDILLHSGDFTMLSSESEIEEFNEALGAVKNRFKHIIVIAGNHEISFDEQTWNRGGLMMSAIKLFFSRSPFATNLNPSESKKLLTNCIYLQDETVELYGIKIYGSPWQPSHFNLAFNLSRGQKLLEKWNGIPVDTDILLTHGPPLGIGDCAKQKFHVGCVELLATVQQRVQPKYHIFGHIHEDHGMWSDGNTVFINASICDRKYNSIQAPVVFDYPLKT